MSSKINFSVPDRTIQYMRHRILRSTKKKLIDTLVDEQVKDFENNLRARMEELLADLTVDEVLTAYNTTDLLGPKLHMVVMWGGKPLKDFNTSKHPTEDG